MTVYRIDEEVLFPPPDRADPDGLLGVGGDLRPERLILAYSMGIFPWYSEGLPILWFSPDRRMVLEPTELRVGRSLRKSLRRRPYEITLDQAFGQVIRACATVPRPRQEGTWITNEMIDAYEALHHRGLAHSVEAWHQGQLVGGLYGVSLGSAFFGESMFALRPDASKIAFVHAVEQLRRWSFHFVDCQVTTAHLTRFGAVEWDRVDFLARLKRALLCPTRVGQWQLDNEAVGAARVNGSEP